MDACMCVCMFMSVCVCTYILTHMSHHISSTYESCSASLRALGMLSSVLRHGAGLVHGMDGRDGRFQWDRRERGGEGAPEVRFMRFFPELLTLVRGMARAMQPLGPAQSGASAAELRLRHFRSVAWVLLFLLIVTYIFAPWNKSRAS